MFLIFLMFAFLRCADLVTHLNCSKRSASRLMTSGLFPTYRTSDRGDWMVKEEDFDEFMEQRRVDARETPATPTGLKELLRATSERVLEERKSR